MKKTIALLLMVAMTFALVACQSQADPMQTPAAQPTMEPSMEPMMEPTMEPTMEPMEESGAMEKTGMAIITSVGGSTSATAEADGKAKTDGTVVAVTVDANGVITACTIDAVQADIGFSAEGKLTTMMDATFMTKQEKGADYGMKTASSIGKEWNEQIDALSAYCVGKTISEVQGIALNERAAAADEDLAASCTISIGGFLNAIAQAEGNATELGAGMGDKVGVGVITSIAKSKDATAEKAGVAQAYSTYAAVTVNAEGVITSCIIDAVQANVNFDAAGQISGDIMAAVPTKNELGDGYGMKNASSLGKEWYEQAASFAAYCVGKTASEVQGIAMNEEGLAADADLLASVTVHIGDFMSVVAKAAENAK